MKSFMIFTYLTAQQGFFFLEPISKAVFILYFFFGCFHIIKGGEIKVGKSRESLILEVSLVERHTFDLHRYLFMNLFIYILRRWCLFYCRRPL